MTKYVASAFIVLSFLVPSLSYAATAEETRQALIAQLITLIEQEIVVLQAQLAAQDSQPAPTLGSTQTETQIAAITHQISAMDEQADFSAFFGAVQDGYVNLVTNAPVESMTLGGDPVTYSEVNGDTVYRNTKQPAWTYRIELPAGVYSGMVTITDNENRSIARGFAK